jgi:hypothetical protein
MSRHSFRLSAVRRALRGAETAGAAVDRVEINSTTGNIILHMVKPAEAPASAVGREPAERTTRS